MFATLVNGGTKPGVGFHLESSRSALETASPDSDRGLSSNAPRPRLSKKLKDHVVTRMQRKVTIDAWKNEQIPACF